MHHHLLVCGDLLLLSLTRAAKKSSSTVLSLMRPEEEEEEVEAEAALGAEEGDGAANPPCAPLAPGLNPARSLRTRVGWSGRARRVYHRLWFPLELVLLDWGISEEEELGNLPPRKGGRGLRWRRLGWRRRRIWNGRRRAKEAVVGICTLFDNKLA